MSGLGSVAFAVLGLEDVVIGALKGAAEARFALHGGVGSGVDVHDADVAGGDAGRGQGLDHFLTGGLAGGLVVGGEGGFRLDVGGGVHVDDLHARLDGLVERGRDGVGAVGRHDDGLVAAGRRRC